MLSHYGDLGGFADCDPTVTKKRQFVDTTAGPGYAAGAGYTQPKPVIRLEHFSPYSQTAHFWVGDPFPDEPRASLCSINSKIVRLQKSRNLLAGIAAAAQN